jgi:hypothetical protein
MGRGVGLALVAQAVHRLGGAISAVNEVGAVFTVRLPRRGAAPPPDARGVAESDALHVLPSSCRTQVSGLPSSA